MDKQAQKMPLIEEEYENSNGGWFRQNRGMVVAIVIIVILIGGIYALSKKEGSIKESEQEEVAVSEEQGDKTDVVGETKKEEVKEGIVEDQKIVEYAAKGEGVTHLARKALNRYIKEVDSTVNISNEQKIYVEDYLQNKTSSKGLKLGESASFSKDLVKEAIAASEKLSPSQLENLKKYSRIVYPAEA